MAKCYNDLRDEVGILHLSSLREIINGRSSEQVFKIINDQINELNDSYQNQLDIPDKVQFFNDLSNFINKQSNNKISIDPKIFSLYPNIVTDTEISNRMQDQAIIGATSGIQRSDSSLSYTVNPFELSSSEDLFSIFNKDIDLMNKFLVKFKNDMLDLTLFGTNSMKDPSFNNSNEELTKNIAEWVGIYTNSEETKDKLLKDFEGKLSSELAIELSDIKNSNVNSLYRKFAAYHFDSLLKMIDNKIIKKTVEGYAPNIKSSIRKGWTDNEFIDFFDEMGSFSKEIIKSRKILNIKGEYTGEYIQIDHLFNLMNKMYKGVDRTDNNYMKNMLSELLRLKTSSRKLSTRNKMFTDEFLNQFSSRDINTILSFYMHFFSDSSDKFLQGHNIIKGDNDASKIVSFNTRSRNSHKDVKLSNSIDYFDLIKYNFEKQTGNTYSQVVYDWENSSFKTETLNTNVTNKRKKEIQNSINYKINHLFTYDKLFNDILQDQLGFIIYKDGDMPINISKDGFELNLKTGGVVIPKGGIFKIENIMPLFDLILSDNSLIKTQDFIDYIKDIITDKSQKTDKYAISIIAPIVAKSLNSIYQKSINKDLSIMLLDKDSSETEIGLYSQVNKGLQYYSEWRNVVSGDDVKSITMTANDTAVPSYGLLNMVKEIGTLISFVKKQYNKAVGGMVSPLKGNLLVDNYEAMLDPVTNTFISYKGKVVPVAKATSEEIFYNDFVLQYLYNIGSNGYNVSFQPTTYSDKSKQTAIRINGKKVTFNGKTDIGRMDLNDVKEMLYSQTQDYYNSIISNIKISYNQMFNTNYGTLQDIENHISKNNLSDDNLFELADIKGLNLDQNMFIEKGKMNSFLKAVDSGEYNFKKELEGDLSRSIDLMYDNNINIDFDSIKSTLKNAIENSSIYNGTLKTYEDNWVDNTTRRLIFRDSKGKINPLIERYFYEKNSFSEAFQHLVVGGVFSHPAKGYISNMTDNVAKRYVAMTKRTVGVQATIHPYKVGLYNGVSYFDKIAYVNDPTMNLFNQLGDIDHMQEVTDGASFSNYLSTILKNNSLLDQGGQIHHKSIGMMIDPITGAFKLMKHADHTMTNERIKNSVYAPYKLKLMMKKMLDLNFGEDIDITKSFLGKDIIKDHDLKIKYKNSNGLIETVESLSYKGGNIYDIKSYIYQDGVKKYQPLRTELIDSLYKLWEVFGAENSVGMSSNNRRLISDDSSWYNLAEIVNNVGFYKNKENKSLNDHLEKNINKYNNYKEFRKSLNDQRYENDDKIEYSEQDRPTADSLYQPLKDKFISQITFTSAQKVGATNINKTDVLSNDKPLRFYGKYNNLYTGLQLDHEHHVDDSDVTEPTQILSAIFFNGEADQYNKQISSAIKEYIVSSISDYLQSNEKIQNINPQQIREIIGNRLVEELGKKDLGGLSIRLSKKIQSDINSIIQKANKDLKGGDFKEYNNSIRQLKNIKTDDLPFSDPGIYKIAVNSINNLFTMLGIRRKLEGSMNVISPQNYFITVHEKGGKIYLGEEFDGQEEYIPITKQDIKPFDNLRIRLKGSEEYILKNINNYYDYIEFLKDSTDYEIERVEGAARRLLPHRIQFELNGNTKDYYSTDSSKLSNYPAVINKYIKNGNIQGALDLAYELKTCIYNSSSRYNVKYDLKDIIDHIDSFILNARNNKNPQLEYKAEWKNLFKNIQLESYKQLKTDRVSYYSIEDIEDMIKSDTLQFVISDKSILDNITNSYNSGNKEAFYKSLIINDPELFKAAIDNYTEIPAEVMMPANLGKIFMIEEGDNINDIDANVFANRISRSYQNKKNVSPLVKYEAMLVENQGDNIYVVNPEEFSKLTGKMTPAYKYNGFSDQKNIIDNDNQKVSRIGSLRFFNYSDENGKRYKIATYSNPEDVKLLNDFEDGVNRYSVFINSSDSDEIVKESIINHSLSLYNNFKLSLNGMMCRIPSQSKQSGMPMKIVGFIKTENNISFVPAENLFLTGGDYDIDKIVQTLLSFNRNGKLNKFSDYFIERDSNFLLESLSLPIADNKSRKVSLYNQTDTKDNNIYYLNEKEQDLLIRFKNNHENDTQEFTLEDFQLTSLLLNNLSNFENIKSLSNDGEIQDLLNDYFVDGYKYNKNLKSIENIIVGAMFHAYNDGRNSIHTYAPMDASVIKDVAKDSKKGKIMQNFTPTNIMTDVLMQITNMVGKDGIAIAATGQKALAVIVNRFLQIKNGKFDNIKLNTDIATQIAKTIGESADQLYMINGFDKKDMQPQLREYFNTLFKDEEFKDGKKQEFIDKYIDSVFAEGDLSLSSSELITLSTDFSTYNYL